MPLNHERTINYLITWATGIAIVVLVAGFTHLVAVLILPSVASKDAYSLLQTHGTTNRMVLLPASRPGDTLVPFRDPATIQGICFYDVRKAPVRIRAQTQDGRLLTFSFRTPEGKIFYSMTDRAALHDLIDIRLVTQDQLDQVESGDDEDAGLPSELRLKAPTMKGLIVATALVTRPSEAQAAETRIKAITCSPEPLPEPQG